MVLILLTDYYFIISILIECFPASLLYINLRLIFSNTKRRLNSLW